MFSYLMIIMVIFLLNLLMVLICIGFFTLLERKILSYINIRKGPNKVGYFGLFQPFSDAVKLFSKEIYLIMNSNYYFYMMSPIFMMLIMLMIWMIIPFKINLFYLDLSLFIMLCLMSMNVIFLMFCGWSSNSIYSMLGAIRSIAQFISYEVSLILILLSLIFLIESFSFMKIINFQKEFWMFFMMYFLSMIFFISILAELNRTPFDLSESESELVSGFNVEYMSGMFGLIFMSEYGMMIFMMFLFNMLYFGSNYFYLSFYLKLLMFLFLLIWIRGSLPRIRYDKLMLLVWKKYLLISLNYLFIVFYFKLLFI